MKKYKVALYLVNLIVIVSLNLIKKILYKFNQYLQLEISVLQLCKDLIVNIKLCFNLHVNLFLILL